MKRNNAFKEQMSKIIKEKYIQGIKMGYQKGHKFLGNLDKPNYFQKGQIPWNKGKKYHNLSEAGLNHYSKRPGFIHSRKGKKLSKSHYESLLKSGIWDKGKRVPWNTGKHWSDELKKKLSDAHIGQKAWNKGLKLPQFSKENHPGWKGGISKEPYDFNFNDTLKEKIRNRDNHICQNCEMTEEEHLIVYGQSLRVHHIDYNKKNSKEDNLISLCQQCHARTNYNRNVWKMHFQEK